MKRVGYKKIKWAVIVVAILTVLVIITVTADGVTPGSDQDPIVTQSYVELKSTQLKSYIDTLLAKVNETTARLDAAAGVKNQEVAKLQSDLTASNQEITNMKAEIAKLTTQVQTMQTTQPAYTKFLVVQLNKNKVLIAGEGAEIIARSGKFSAIVGTNGGLSDVTSAKDLKTGEAIVNNHLLIASRNDGRGIKSLTDNSFLIIKGTYTLK